MPLDARAFFAKSFKLIAADGQTAPGQPPAGELKQLSGDLPTTSERSSAALLRHAIARTRQWLLAEQHADGHWVGELEGDTILESEYILLLAWLGREQEPVAVKCAQHMLNLQLA